MKAIVTGGGGFLGRAIVEALLARGHSVTAIGRTPRPEIEALGARFLCVDLLDKPGLRAACDGVDTMFHVAAKTGVWGPAAEYERTNVDGTRHALAAAQAARMPRFVFTSTPSVVFDGRDHRSATSDLPYAKRFLCAYPRTKAIAEREVLYANARFGLTTCALRPHLIFGPRDPHLLPRLIARARAGRLAIVGDGTNEVTLAYVDNAALAHVLAAERLTPEAAHAGRAYFVGEPEPVRLWPWIGEVLGQLGIPVPTRRVPLRRAYAAGAACELAWRILRRPGDPPLTRFVALQLGTSHSYDVGEAERDFGCRPALPMRAAVDRTVAALRAGS